MELIIFYVETRVRYINSYGDDIDEQFYMSIEGMLEQVFKYVNDNELDAVFKARFLEVANDSEGIGWGLHDQLCEIYYGYQDE